MVVIFEETNSAPPEPSTTIYPLTPHPHTPTAISSALVHNCKAAARSLRFCNHFTFVSAIDFLACEGKERMSEWVGSEGGRGGAREGGNREVRGCAMPGSHTVTMTTDITSQEQHLGCLCGLKWHSWRLALASCGCHNVPILSWLAFCFISSTALLKCALLLLSATYWDCWEICTLCANVGPASLA